MNNEKNILFKNITSFIINRKGTQQDRIQMKMLPVTLTNITPSEQADAQPTSPVSVIYRGNKIRRNSF